MNSMECVILIGLKSLDILEVTHEGTNQVKESKINLLTHQYKFFKMENDETIKNIFPRLTNIVNGLNSLKKTYPNGHLVNTILRSLPKSCVRHRK